MLLYHSNHNYTFYGKDNGRALFRKRHKKRMPAEHPICKYIFSNQAEPIHLHGHSYLHNNFYLQSTVLSME